jgi:hypothetical protein
MRSKPVIPAISTNAADGARKNPSNPAQARCPGRLNHSSIILFERVQK